MSKFRFDKKAKAFEAKKQGILDGMANNAVTYFKVTSFDKKSFDGKAWVPNKVQTGRQQLVKTARMRNSISVLKRSKNSRLVWTNVPYAKYQNNDKHEFIGRSRELEAKNLRYLEKNIKL
jgi:phage gpG-like protein